MNILAAYLALCQALKMRRTSNSVSEVVKTGLCIGCGLCEAITGGRINMRINKSGSLRPSDLDGFSPDEETEILAACPGVKVEPRLADDMLYDPVWGHYSTMQVGWAADADVRYKASTGGVLTALAVSLLKTQKVAFILHVCADPNNPMRSQWVMSKTPADVIKCTGSRYGPTAPLAGFYKALEKGQKFSIIAKPCDLSAVHNLSKTDARVNAFCTVRMALICGGQSKLSKSQQLLSQFNITENDLSCFRYRGHGNPGPAHIKTKDGHVFEVSYNKLWESQSNWDLETRCKLCPDALGETADIVASDIWPGGGPSGEDAGFNGIITRSMVGNEVLNDAKDGGDLILGETISIAQYNKFQPHQLRRKQAIKARFDARIFAGLPEIGHDGLRIPELSYAPDGSNYHRQRDGTVKRIAQGKMTE